jgi:hypothetical protein
MKFDLWFPYLLHSSGLIIPKWPLNQVYSAQVAPNRGNLHAIKHVMIAVGRLPSGIPRYILLVRILGRIHAPGNLHAIRPVIIAVRRLLARILSHN